MSNQIDTAELDQQIAAAEAAAQALRQAKAMAQAAADEALRKSAIYQKQQEWLQADAARRAAILEAFTAGPLATVQAQAEANAAGEAQFLADCAELAELVKRLRAMQARLAETQAGLFNARDQAALALVKALLAHAWDDFWMHQDPANPDKEAVKQFTTWATALFDADLISEFLPANRSTETIIKAQSGLLAFQIEAKRERLEWADSAMAAQNAARQRHVEARLLGLIP